MWMKDADLPEDGTTARHLPFTEVVRRIAPLVRPHAAGFAAGIALLVVSAGSELAGPLVLRHLIDVDIAARSKDGILASAALYAGLFLLGTLANYAQTVVLTKMGLAIVTSLKRTLFHHVLGQSMA